jgi:cell division protein FtsA
VFTNGSIRHTAVIPIAGDQVTNDIAVALRTSSQIAEEIKLKHACAVSGLVDPQEVIDVPASAGERTVRKLSRAVLAEVVEPRYEELLMLVQAELRRQGLEEALGSGIVVTGGSSKVEGMIALAEEVFRMPVRLGYPRYVTGLTEVTKNPIYATGVGLLLYAREQQMTRHTSDFPINPVQGCGAK